MSDQYSLSPVEQAIRQAMRDGLFDNLPGMGKPLKINWDEENQVPDDMRLANKIMKDHQVAPEWMMLGGALEAQHAKIMFELKRGFHIYIGTLQDADRAGDLGKRSRARITWERLTQVFMEVGEQYNRNILTYNLKVPPGIAKRPFLDIEREIERLQQDSSS